MFRNLSQISKLMSGRTRIHQQPESLLSATAWGMQIMCAEGLLYEKPASHVGEMSAWDTEAKETAWCRDALSQAP